MNASDPKLADHDHYVVRILAALAGNPDRIAVRWRGGEITAGRFAAATLHTAERLRGCGVRPGRTVAVLTGPNHPAMLVARYAAHLVGAAVVYIRSTNPRSDAVLLPEAAQSEILAATGAQLLIADETLAGRALRVAWRTPNRPAVLRLTAEPPGTYHGGPADLAAVRHSPDDRAMVGFTSGSTGRPKLVDQSFRVWHNLIRRLADGVDPTGAIMLAVTPVSHTVGPMLDAVLSRGGGVVLHERFDASDVLRCIQTVGITDVYLAVPHLCRLLDHPDVARFDRTSLRRVVYSGTPAAAHRVRAAFGRFGASVIQVYGTAEAGGITSLGPLDHAEPELARSVGRPFPWVEVRIGDPTTESGRPNETGEIWVRSETVMDGYLGDPEQTADVLRDGWLRTGDIGFFDRYGCLRLTGRVADVISSDGVKVYPAAVERALLDHPDVTRAAVYAIRDLDRVEYVHAAVELRAGSPLRPLERFRDHVARVLTPPHAPTAFTVWDRLPCGVDGRPDRARLRGRPVTSFVGPPLPM